MGTFFTNLHVRIDSNARVMEMLKSMATSRAYVSSCENHWVSVFDEQIESQDEDKIQELAMGLSRELASAVFAFMVHDSDVFCYWLYVRGSLIDKYNSNPAYFTPVPDELRAQLSGKPELLLPYCDPQTTCDRIREILKQRKLPSKKNEPVFEETRVIALAELLGISAICATASFSDLFEEGQDADRMQVELVNEGVESHEDAENEALHQAVTSGQIDTVKRLVEAGANVRTRYPGGNLLGYAIGVGDPAVVKFLLDQGADACTADGDPFGRPPLILATFVDSRSEIIELLVKAGGKVNQASDIQFTSNDRVFCGVTPLMCAARFCEFELVKTLLKFGANPKIKDASGKTAHDYAVEKKAWLEAHIPRAANPELLRDRFNKVKQIIELLSSTDIGI